MPYRKPCTGADLYHDTYNLKITRTYMELELRDLHVVTLLYMGWKIMGCSVRSDNPF